MPIEVSYDWDFFITRHVILGVSFVKIADLHKSIIEN